MKIITRHLVKKTWKRVRKIIRIPIWYIRSPIFRTANALRKEVIHLFLLSPPLSGSTVIQQLLATSPYVTAFKTEGQWLPEARKLLTDDRWNPDLQIDWKEVKKVFNSYWSPFKPIRFEKSPPHILRAMQLDQMFENCYFLMTIRNPYAQIEGGLRRKWLPSPQFAAEFWIKTANAQIHNLEILERKLFFTYEELTEKTEEVVHEIIDFLPELGSISTNTLFTVHNQPIYGLKNLNQSKINNLTQEQFDEINSVFSKHEAILAKFGYKLLTYSDMKS